MYVGVTSYRVGIYYSVGRGGLGDSRWDCCACVEQKALITEILQKAGEEVLKVIQWRNRAGAQEPSSPLIKLMSTPCLHISTLIHIILSIATTAGKCKGKNEFLGVKTDSHPYISTVKKNSVSLISNNSKVPLLCNHTGIKTVHL